MNLRAQIRFLSVCLVSPAFVLLKCDLANGQPALPLPSQPIRSTAEQLDEIIDRQKRIERDIQEIKTILQRATGQVPSPPAQFDLSLESAPFKGNKDAKVIIIEFSDYQCPFCSRHFRETLPEIEKEYLKTGKLKYVFWDFPLETVHREAFKAHEAAHCAEQQGKYWEMHDRLFDNQESLGTPELPKHAEAVGLKPALFQQCLTSGKYAAKIRASIADARRIGVNATPTFFLLKQGANNQPGTVLDIIRGAQAYAQFKEKIEKALAE